MSGCSIYQGFCQIGNGKKHLPSVCHETMRKYYLHTLGFICPVCKQCSQEDYEVWFPLHIRHLRAYTTESKALIARKLATEVKKRYLTNRVDLDEWQEPPPKQMKTQPAVASSSGLSELVDLTGPKLQSMTSSSSSSVLQPKNVCYAVLQTATSSDTPKLLKAELLTLEPLPTLNVIQDTVRGIVCDTDDDDDTGDVDIELMNAQDLEYTTSSLSSLRSSPVKRIKCSRIERSSGTMRIEDVNVPPTPASKVLKPVRDKTVPYKTMKRVIEAEVRKEAAPILRKDPNLERRLCHEDYKPKTGSMMELLQKQYALIEGMVVQLAEMKEDIKEAKEEASNAKEEAKEAKDEARETRRELLEARSEIDLIKAELIKKRQIIVINQ